MSLHLVVVLAILPLLISLSRCQSQISICADGGLSVSSFDGRSNDTLFDDPSIDPYYIYSQDDVDYLVQNNCTNILTRVIINPNSTSASNISLKSIQRIGSHLDVVSSTTLGMLSAPSLVRITGNFSLTDLSDLSNLSLPLLKSVATLSMSSLPSLRTLDFPASIDSDALNITNTALETIQGFYNIRNTINVENNPHLVTLNLEHVYGSSSSSTVVKIVGNGPATDVNLFDLSFVQSLNISDCAALDMSYLISAQHITVHNTLISSLEMPRLGTINDLTISDNPNLTGLNLSELSVTNYLNILNNPVFSTLNNSNVPDLHFATNLVVVGNMSSISLPNLQSVRNLTLIGNITSFYAPEIYYPTWVDISTTYPSFDCSVFDVYASKEDSKFYSCRASVPGSSRDTATHIPGYGKHSLSTGAKAGIGVGVSIGVILIIFAACKFRRRRKKTGTSSPQHQGWNRNRNGNSNDNGDLASSNSGVELHTHREDSDVDLPKYEINLDSTPLPGYHDGIDTRGSRADQNSRVETRRPGPEL